MTFLGLVKTLLFLAFIRACDLLVPMQPTWKLTFFIFMLAGVMIVVGAIRGELDG